jgi:anaerobic selenocysteine-containing dehydrogenase
MLKTHYRACHLCEAICGLKIETRGEEVISIKGDPDDPLSRGHICPKAVALKDIHEDPDRLRYPVRRITRSDGGHDWEEISWDEALDATADALLSVHREHGVDAIGVYMGNPTVHNYGMLTHQNYLFRWLRTRNRFSATSVDQLPHHLASLWLFGHKSLFPIPDIDRSDYFLMLGANPLASNGSLWTVPDVRNRIKALRRRGGRLVVIDPRRTETAQLASDYHAIVPGSDALFLAAILHTLFAENLADPGHLAPFTRGLDTVRQAIAAFTPERAAAHCRIEADVIRGIARDFAAAGAAICYGRMGVSTPALRRALPVADPADQYRHGQPRPRGWLDVHAAGSGPGAANRPRRLCPPSQSRPRPARVRSRTARCGTRGRDHDPRGRPDPRPVHRRRQPGPVHPRRPCPRRGAGVTGLHGIPGPVHQ